MKARIAYTAIALFLTPLPWGCAEPETPTGSGGKQPADSLVDGYKRDGSLPMLVSANGFDPSGYMGDGGSSPGAVRMDTAQCLTPRGARAAGVCYKITYAPGSMGWAGVYWQYPKNNWGGAKGRPVQAGARKLTFYAASPIDSLEVEIMVGGINPYLADGEFQDGFRAQGKFRLSKAWTRHALEFDSTAAYTDVIGGFGWSLPGGTATEPLVFWLDDIKWEK